MGPGVVEPRFVLATHGGDYVGVLGGKVLGLAGVGGNVEELVTRLPFNGEVAAILPAAIPSTLC